MTMYDFLIIILFIAWWITDILLLKLSIELLRMIDDEEE